MDWTGAKCTSNPGFTDVSQTFQKKFCEGCDIKDDCLQYALDNPRLTAGNVYGGKTTQERNKISIMLALPLVS
jgi:hypothetical protein